MLDIENNLIQSEPNPNTFSRVISIDLSFMKVKNDDRVINYKLNRFNLLHLFFYLIFNIIYYLIFNILREMYDYYYFLFLSKDRSMEEDLSKKSFLNN